MCWNIGAPENINVPLGTDGKSMVLGVPKLKHFRVFFNMHFLFRFSKQDLSQGQDSSPDSALPIT